MNMFYYATFPRIAGRPWQESSGWHEMGIGIKSGMNMPNSHYSYEALIKKRIFHRTSLFQFPSADR